MAEFKRKKDMAEAAMKENRMITPEEMDVRKKAGAALTLLTTGVTLAYPRFKKPSRMWLYYGLSGLAYTMSISCWRTGY